MNAAVVTAWDSYLRQAERYFDEHGNLDVPYNYQIGPYRLWEWLDWQRNRHRKGVLPAERASALERMGVDWTVEADEGWETFYTEARRFYAANGHLFVPLLYRTESGYDLGRWIAYQRERYTGVSRRHKNMPPLSEEEIAALEDIGMVWENVEDARWEVMYALVRDYVNANGHLPRSGRDGKAPDGRDLGHWVHNQRLALRQGKYDADRAERLREIGITGGEETP